MKNTLFQDALVFWAKQMPQRLAAVIDGDEGITYAELDRWSDGIAARLQEMGVKPGDNVAMTGANCLEWIPAAFGILKAGGTIVPYNDRFVKDEVRFLLDFSEPTVIIADAGRRDLLSTMSVNQPIEPMEMLGHYRQGAPAGWTAARVDSDTLAMIIFTSGTTGTPKGVMVSHAQGLDKFAEQILAEPAFRTVEGGGAMLMPLSLHAAPGTQAGYMLSTVLGTTFHCMRKYDAQMALEILTDHGITILLGMPIMCEQVARLPGFAAADLSGIKYAVVGGARVQRWMLDAWREKGVVLRQLYGMTEVGGTGIFASATEALAKPEYCGRGLMGTRIRVVRPDGNDCGANEPGAVLIKGPGMMVGYWRNPEATAKAVIDGWMHSGDIGEYDEDGYFRFIDRSKEMIISGGYNISPAEIEAVIAQIDGVVEVAVFSVPDDKFGETPGACVHAAAHVTPEQVFAHCKTQLAGFKLPRYIVPHEEPLPRMASGKIAKRALADEFRDAPSRYPKFA